MKYLRNITYYFSEIHLVIQGRGEQNLLSPQFVFEPSEVFVNEVKRESCHKDCNLDGVISNITLRFINEIKSIYCMFCYLTNITEVDLSKFNTSMVITMSNMFKNCHNLTKINFGNIDTSSVNIWIILFPIVLN